MRSLVKVMRIYCLFHGLFHGIVLDVAVILGDASDQEPYLKQMVRVLNIVQVQAATADSIYNYSLFHQVFGDLGVDLFVRPMKWQSQKNIEFGRERFDYIKTQDVFCCTNSKDLTLSAIIREPSTLHWVYATRKKDCQTCPCGSGA